MEAVILTGIQGCGKTTFYLDRFLHSHVRISLDVVRKRRRERLLTEACLRGGQRFVIDNTNPARSERARYIGPARAARFRVVGYYFPPDLEACKRRNAQRPDKRAVPLVGLLATYKRLERPEVVEGFDELYEVTVEADGGFAVRAVGVREDAGAHGEGA